MTRPNDSHAFVMFGLFAEMALDEAIRRREEAWLLTQIDEALRDRDESAFVKLAGRLRELRDSSV
ncbi:IDEAL domain-containing protein [Paenibacillus abyssi]|uniref:IDEAL domain-containing protein n=1 Tax=Paenibacillus abyssi TaxID=1340531 RepID=A0A917CIZ3_9BACL|nr:IDEAL domain-containing protein [Paenibacillus abyssi]GGF87982.1 hypothetical protein GCM10010916_01620 [Paenibacillus abyssi]